jgi:hypothetical protein
VRFAYKIAPLKVEHPAYPSEDSIWMPMLPVCVSYGHGAKTPRIEALIDSGSQDTLFHSSIGRSLHIPIEKGPRFDIGGIAKGVKISVYYHDIRLWIGAEVVKIKVGFCEEMSVSAILGRKGFFEHYRVTFDPSATPPGFEIERIGRA